MHRPLGFLRPTPPPADQDILEQLLDGRLDPASAPPGYGKLARLLAAADGPGRSTGAGQPAAGDGHVRSGDARRRPPTLSPRRTPVPSKVFTIKAAAAALVAVLSIGGIAAAATGLLPGQASPVADQATATTAADAAAHGLGKAAAADLAGTAQAGSTEGQVGRRRLGPTPLGRPGPGCVGPGRLARVPTMDAGWTRWPSRRWQTPPVAATTSPPTARM